MKKLGILIYIDNTDQMLEEFYWIYKSWIFSGNFKNSDLVTVANPRIIDKIPSHPGIVKVPCLPYSETNPGWEDYKFINSIGCLFGEHLEGLADNYEYLLRTDADVFLTKNLVDFYPSRPVHGRGLYANPIGKPTLSRFKTHQHETDVWEKIVEFSERIGLQHNRVFNCGHSLLAKSEDVLFFIEEQTRISGILREEFREGNKGSWPGWFSGVITMYASEIVANHHYDRYLRSAHLNILDRESYFVGPIDSLTMHIHAIHTEDYFSKLRFRRGEYSNVSIKDLDISKINQYCHFIAGADLGYIKYLSNFPY